jgi:hypothetical protein
MAPKHHPAPLSGGDRKALKKELSKSRAMTRIFAERSAEKRREGEALIREADNLACQSWNERMWSDGGPIDPSPTIDQAINGGLPSVIDTITAVRNGELDEQLAVSGKQSFDKTSGCLRTNIIQSTSTA